MTEEELRELVAESAWGAYAAVLELYIKPALKFHTAKSAAPLPIGVSRFGGDPDMPEEWAWPEWKGKSESEGEEAKAGPLAFLCQINMGEFPKTKFTRPLPGILYVFYDPEQRSWGFDPADRGAWRVLHYSGPLEGLKRRPAPTAESRYDECAVSYSVSFGLPGNPEKLSRPETIDEEKWEGLTGEPYFELLTAMNGSGPNHAFGGYATPIQGDEMERECALASNGIFCGDDRQFTHPDCERVAATAGEWILLLQIDTDEEGPGWMWGDGGMLYLWCRKAEMARFEFSNAWCVLQCF